MNHKENRIETRTSEGRTGVRAVLAAATVAVVFVALTGTAAASVGGEVGVLASASATGDTTSPGGQATVNVTAQDAGSVVISNIPSSWSVASSQNEGATVAPDGIGDNVSGQGTVSWAWSNDQSEANVSVTFDIPSGANIQNYTLDVEVEDSAGNNATTTADVEVQLPVTATGDSASVGGNATVSVQANNTGSVTVSNIPTNWTVESSTNQGSFLSPDGPNGNQISSQGSVLWVWNSDQQNVNVDVTLGVPSNAATGDVSLDVEAENNAGETGTDTATVSVLSCPFDPVVCTYDPNGNIDTGDLQDAISDFIQQKIDTGDLQAVIQAFIQNQAP